MTHTLKLKFLKYFEIGRIAYYNNTTFFGDVLGIGGLVAARTWIFSQLYTVAFGLAKLSDLGGVTLAQTIWILGFAQSFHVSNRTRMMMLAIEYDIKSGTIGYSIGKPYSYLLFHFFSCFGVITSYLGITIFFTSIVALLLVGPINFSLPGIIFGAVLLLFGFALNSLVVLILGLLSFWTEEAKAFRWIYDKILWVFGGLFLPISVYPEKMQKTIELLPFSHMFYGPARMMTSFDIDRFWKYLLIQVVWVMVFGLFARYLYKQGTKNITINGG